MIWPIFIIISVTFAIVTGNIDKLNNSIFNSSEEAIKLCITLLGTICLWSGLMEIVNKTTITEWLTKLIKPIMKWIFPDIKENSRTYNEISMNIVANILGLGNAATPLGLKAMKSMQKENVNKERLTDSMASFIVFNTVSVQIIPTTIIAIRTSLGSNNPTSIIIPIWISSICSGIAGIIATKIFIKIGK